MGVSCKFSSDIRDLDLGYQERAKRFMACLDAAKQRQLRLLASLEAEQETGAMGMSGLKHGDFTIKITKHIKPWDIGDPLVIFHKHFLMVLPI